MIKIQVEAVSLESQGVVYDVRVGVETVARYRSPDEANAYAEQLRKEAGDAD
jgi:Holliday junction resolvasome RuvABC DNA-binding subunit